MSTLTKQQDHYLSYSYTYTKLWIFFKNLLNLSVMQDKEVTIDKRFKKLLL